MGIPGFTAEASLFSASNHYYVHGMYHRTEQQIYPADFIDQTCLAECKQDCGIVCAEFVGEGRRTCIRQCAQDNAACNVTCTRPGSPPFLGGSPSSLLPCTSDAACPAGETCKPIRHAVRECFPFPPFCWTDYIQTIDRFCQK